MYKIKIFGVGVGEWVDHKETFGAHKYSSDKYVLL